MTSWQPPDDERSAYPGPPAYSESPVYPDAPAYPESAAYPDAPGYPNMPGGNAYAAGYPQPGPPAYAAPYPNPYAPPTSGYGYPAGGDRRPGTLTAAAVLGYVSAGLLIVAALLLFEGASIVNDIDQSFGGGGTVTAELVVDGVVNLVAGGLLIAGSVMMTGRRGAGRTMYTFGTGIVIAAAIYWLARWSGPVGNAAGVIFYALMFAALAIVGVSLAWTSTGTGWLRRGGR